MITLQTQESGEDGQTQQEWSAVTEVGTRPMGRRRVSGYRTCKKSH